MDLLEIPFVKTVGLSKTIDGTLKLEMHKSVSNHLGTMHASALFTLAETASGQILIDSFPDFLGKAVPVVRESNIQFKRPANGQVRAFASITPEASKSLLEQMETRGRGSIDVDVEIKDSNSKLVSKGTFSWHIQAVT